MTHVWLWEIEEADDEGHPIYTGRFDIDRQWRAAGGPEGFGWMTPHSLAFEVTAVIQAPTHRPLRASVRGAVLEALLAATGTEPYGAPLRQ